MEYKRIIEFWNKTFQNLPPQSISGKLVNDVVFNETIKEYIKDESNILDFGCGSGWSLFEIAYTVKLAYGIGIDSSENAINSLSKTKELSNLSNLDFIIGDQITLSNYDNYFDAIVSFNVIDVLPNEVIEAILKQFNKSIKKNGYIIISINPDFPLSMLEKAGYLLKENCLYKDGVLRGNIKTKDEWINLFKRFFNFIDYKEFALIESEKAYPRRMFILMK